MTPIHKKRTLAASWIVAVLVTALAAGVGSPMSWLTVLVVAFGPSLMLLYFWKELPKTTSQRIQEARR
jgi:hypothetical protein